VRHEPRDPFLPAEHPIVKHFLSLKDVAPAELADLLALSREVNVAFDVLGRFGIHRPSSLRD
jgi:hypothetical protein